MPRYLEVAPGRSVVAPKSLTSRAGVYGRQEPGDTMSRTVVPSIVTPTSPTERGPARGPILRTAALVGLVALLLLVVGPLAVAAGEDGGSPPDPHPSTFTWTNGQVVLGFAGDAPTFWVSSALDGKVNLTVSADGIAEVQPNGSIVAYAAFRDAGASWGLNWTNTTRGVNVTLSGTAPVSAGSGTWNTSELPESGDGALGTAHVWLVFHLTHATNASVWQMKFDVGASSWPWQSTSDRLGIALSVEAADQTTLSTGPSGGEVEESQSGGGTPVANLTWGPVADATYPSGLTLPATVVGHVLASDDQLSSTVDLLFQGVPGGYTSLVYDPTVVLAAHSFPSLAVPPWTITAGVEEAVVAASIVVVLLALVATRSRSAPPRDALARSSHVAPVSSARTGLGLLCRRCGNALRAPRSAGVHILFCPRCETG
jgi:hypothetical protein